MSKIPVQHLMSCDCESCENRNAMTVAIFGGIIVLLLGAVSAWCR